MTGAMKTEQVAEHYGVTARQIKYLAKLRRLPCYRYGRAVRFRASELPAQLPTGRRRAA